MAVAIGSSVGGAPAPSRAADAPAIVDPRLLGDGAWPAADPAARRDVIVALDGDGAYRRFSGAMRTARAAALGALGGAVPGALALRGASAAPPPGDVAPATRARLLGEAYAAVDGAQYEVRGALAARGVPIVSRYETLQNGFLIAASRADIDALARERGVARIMPAPDQHVLLANAVPHIGADQVASTLGLDGKDVTIGVIDTGIDYFHAAFGGPGTSGAYGADDHAAIEPGTFPTAKVIGGYDFAGSQYGGSGAASPDDDPVDENGHGTHVAGIAGGRSWGSLHGGVAPGARLVALKVFGASGSTNLAYDAIEWAVEAKLGRAVPGTAADIDVLNLSLGSAWASSSAFENAIIDQAADAGIVVVGAAGNDGDIAFVTGGPGDAAGAIAVASTVGPGQLGDRVQAVVDGVVSDVEAVESHPSLGARMTGIGRLQAAAIWYGRACAGDRAEGVAAGRIAILERGDCPFRDKLARAAADGALAGVVVDNGGGLVPMGTDGSALAIPAYMIGAADGVRLHSAIALGAAVELRLDGAFNGRFPRLSLVDTVSSFSSRGMTRTGQFKPDIAAPGSGIVAPAIGSGSRAVALSGTSMASPIVAGAAAVLIEALARANHPLAGGADRAAASVTPADIRAILVSTAYTGVKTADARDAGAAPFARRGAGRVALAPAVRARTVLRPSRPSDGAALTFGVRAADRDWAGSVPFTLRNLTAAPRRYALTVEWAGDGEATAGLRFTPAEAVLDVAANGTVESRVLAAVAPRELAPYDLRGGASAMNGDHRLEEADRDAYLVAVEVDGGGRPVESGDVVRAPIWTFLRGASDITAPQTVPVPPDATAVRVPVTNGGDQAGPAESFALLASDPLDAGAAGAFDAVHAGARVVGAGADRRVELALVLAAPSIAPYDVSVEASIDGDSDGAIDHVLTIDDRSAAEGSGAAMTGSLRTIMTDARGQSAAIVGDAGVDVNSRLIVLQASADALGFAAGGPVAFDVAFEVTARFGGARVDSVPDGALRGGRLAKKLHFASDRLGYTVDAPTRVVPAGGSATLSIALDAPLGAQGKQLLAIYPLDAPGAGDAQIIALERGAAAPPTPPPGATPSPTASATPSPTASPGPSVTSAPPTATATDEPTVAPHIPTVVLPVEPTATAALQGTATPEPTRSAVRTERIYLPFAYTYVRRRPR